MGPLESATTTAGQLVAVAGDPADAVGGRPGALLGEGLAGGVLPVVVPLGGPDSPVATADGYIGDADVVSTATSLGGDQLIVLREQRHYARSFARAITLEEGFAPITALTVGMDFRGDSIVLWAQGGEVHAQWVTNDGDVYAAQLLGPAGYAPALAAVLSDNDHAFVMWTDEPAPGRPGEAQDLPRALGQQRRSAGRAAAARDVRRAGGPAPRAGLDRAGPGHALGGGAGRLDADLGRQLRGAGRRTDELPGAAGGDDRGARRRPAPRRARRPARDNDFVAVLESAPRSPSGFDASQQAILAARSVPGGPGGVAFETPTQLAAPGFNSAPSVAIDPDSDRAVVVWQTVVGGVPAVAYAVRTGA